MVWNPGLGGLGLALCLAVVSASTDVESHRIFGRVLQDAMEGSLCGALCQGCAAADVAGGCCGQPDGRVGIADVLGFLGAYGVFPVEEKFDIAGGPGVGVDDILAVLGTYGILCARAEVCHLPTSLIIRSYSCLPIHANVDVRARHVLGSDPIGPGVQRLSRGFMVSTRCRRSGGMLNLRRD